MNDLELAVSNAVNKALNEAMPDIGEKYGAGVGKAIKEIIKQQNEISNSKFNEANDFLNAIVQINVSFFGLLCSTNHEFRESLCAHLQLPPDEAFAGNQYYNQLLDIWRVNLQVTSPNKEHQSSSKSHLKLVIGNRPNQHEDHD